MFANCVYFVIFLFSFYEILFENHILYEKVISIKIIIIIISTESTGSRGDVFVVRKSKPVEKL